MRRDYFINYLKLYAKLIRILNIFHSDFKKVIIIYHSIYIRVHTQFNFRVVIKNSLKNLPLQIVTFISNIKF
jgi:hypothetical protein